MFGSRRGDRQLFTFKKGDGTVSLQKRDLVQVLSDAFDNILYGKADNNIEGDDEWFPNQQAKQYYSNADYWKDTLLNYNSIGQAVTLRNFSIIEWLPSSPGLFFTGKAENLRREALKYINPRYDEYLPLGKARMVLGGIGSVRLGSEFYMGSNKAFLCATSNGASHEGIPLVLERSLYSRIIDEIKSRGYLNADITGSIEVLKTEKSVITFDRGIPKYCVVVTSVKAPIMGEVRTPQERDIFVTIAAAFRGENYSSNELETLSEIGDNFSWTYCSFNPSKNDDNNLQRAVDWLTDYTHRYTYNARIVSDFDEQQNHFQDVDFALREIMSNRFDKNLLSNYKKSFHFKINNVVMGDYFENNSGTIINRSMVTNSLNRVSNGVNSEAAELLKIITEKVLSSGNKDAIDNIEEFHKELQKPEPKKSLLKSFWNGVVVAVPALITNADKVLDIIEKVGNAMGQ